jgi:hypothetical protein
LKDKRNLFTSFRLSDDDQKRGRSGRKSVGRKKKLEKLLSSFMLFVLVFFPFWIKKERRKTRRQRKVPTRKRKGGSKREKYRKGRQRKNRSPCERDIYLTNKTV